MSHIDDLITKLCPHGVKYVRLSDMFDLKKGTNLTAATANPGPYPVVTAGRNQTFTHDEFNYSGEFITVSSHGAYAGFVSYFNSDFWLGNNVYLLQGKKTNVNIRYSFYALQNATKKLLGTVNEGGIPYINAKDLQKISIPFPHLEIQEEIVRILDTFTKLEAELEAELEARKKQFFAYRDGLLVFGNLSSSTFDTENVNVKTIEEVLGKIPRGKRLTKSSLASEGIVPVFHGGLDPIGFHNEANTPANTVMIINTGASSGTVGWSDREFWCSDGCFALPQSEEVLPRFLYYCASSQEKYFVDRVRKAGIPTLASESVLSLKIPVPSLHVQNRIVEILDSFDILVNNFETGIPAELKSRRAQYEFYRNKLLTFHELSA